MAHSIYTLASLLSLFNLCIRDTLASSLSESATNTNQQYIKMFGYNGLSTKENNRRKPVAYIEEVARQFVTGQKPKGLHKTLLDLDFPTFTNDRTTIHRVVQFLLNGEVTEMQRELYKDVELKISSTGVYQGLPGKCKNDFVVKLTKGSAFKAHGFFVPEIDGVETKFSLGKDETKVVKFENVFGDDFPMDRFWVNFTVKGKCSPFLYVELLKPNNMADSLN